MILVQLKAWQKIARTPDKKTHKERLIHRRFKQKKYESNNTKLER